MQTSSRSWGTIWTKYNDYVSTELMFDSLHEEILGFAEWVEAHFGISKEESEEWFYVHAEAN